MCIVQAQTTNVSRETFTIGQNTENKFLEKIKFCKDIVSVDPMRVKIELQEIIDLLEK